MSQRLSKPLRLKTPEHAATSLFARWAIRSYSAVMVRKTPMIARRQRQQSIVFMTEGLRPAEAILNCRIPG